MLLLYIQNLATAPVIPVNATATASLPVIFLTPMRPLWVSETPEDTIMVTPNPAPVGSFE